MSRTIRPLLVMIGILLVGNPVAHGDDQSVFEWMYGVIDNGNVYFTSAVIESEPRDETTWFQHRITYASLSHRALLKSGTKKAVDSKLVGRYAPLRWRFWDGMYWGLLQGANDRPVLVKRIPMKYLDLLDPTDWTKLDMYREIQPRSLAWCLRPIDQVIAEHSRAVYLRKTGMEFDDPNFVIEKKIYCDVLPTAPDIALVFVVEDNRVRLWQGKSRKATKSETQELKRDFVVSWNELKGQGFASGFTEPFQAFGDADTWYFMTASRKLYVSKKPAEGQQRKMQVLYDDADSSIKALVTDTATNKTFAFTAPDDPKSGNGKRVYFELAPKLDVKPYEVNPLKNVTVDYRLKTVWELAQVLVADGKVKLPSEK